MVDLETCSICTSEWPIEDLKPHTFPEGDTWELVCPDCRDASQLP